MKQGAFPARPPAVRYGSLVYSLSLPGPGRWRYADEGHEGIDHPLSDCSKVRGSSGEKTALPGAQANC